MIFAPTIQIKLMERSQFSSLSFQQMTELLGAIDIDGFNLQRKMKTIKANYKDNNSY